jgi:tetratricopeptide (TPR) repeat protein
VGKSHFVFCKEGPFSHKKESFMHVLKRSSILSLGVIAGVFAACAEEPGEEAPKQIKRVSPGQETFEPVKIEAGPYAKTSQDWLSVQDPTLEGAKAEEYTLALANRNTQPEHAQTSGISHLDVWESEAKKPSVDALERDYFALGLEKLSEGQTDRAIELFQNAVYIQDSPQNWAALGDAYLRAGQGEKGAQYLEYALEEDGSLMEVRKGLIKHYVKHDKRNEALYHAIRMERMTNQDASHSYLAGRAYMKNEMWSEAITAFERVIQKETENVWAANNASFSALQIGQNEVAIQFLEPHVGSSGMTHTMYNNIGVAYERVGRQSDAAFAFMKAHALKPAYVKAQINKDRVWARLSDDQKDAAQHMVANQATPIDVHPLDVTGERELQ